MNISKRILSIFLAFALCTGVMTLGASAKAQSISTHVAIVKASSLRLRSGPSTESSVISTAPKGDYVVITGKTGVWYLVNHNLKQGYMHQDYLDAYTVRNVELGYGTATGSNVNLRSGPGISYASVDKLGLGEKAYIIGFNRQWYKVIHDQHIGYIRSDYLKLTQVPYENQNSTNVPRFFVNGVSTGVPVSPNALNGSDIRQRIVAEAQKYIGTAYVWGGSTPGGFDCSGFTQYVLKQCGISIPRTTTEQAAVGTYIPKSKLQPGDLVFLQNTYRAGISHVGIYIGNGQMIHASSSKGVTISNLSGSYYTEHYHSSRQLPI